ncbi:BMP and activin membrane-bound inhibitor homolog isoform X1 [Vicugna pacos]|uniref:BMP and activin membrane-bound inhibitor homolog isoform X1 n=1 Tax=Vicugna pacos TaxID=30538 RepID=A0ABM5CSC1_VICPA
MRGGEWGGGALKAPQGSAAPLPASRLDALFGRTRPGGARLGSATGPRLPRRGGEGSEGGHAGPSRVSGEQKGSHAPEDAGQRPSCEDHGGGSQRQRLARPAAPEGHGRTGLREGERGRRRAPARSPRRRRRSEPRGRARLTRVWASSQAAGLSDRSLAANRAAPALPGRDWGGAGAGRCQAGSPRGALFTARSRADLGRRRRELAAGSFFALGVCASADWRAEGEPPERSLEPTRPRRRAERRSRDCRVGRCSARPPAALHAPAAARSRAPGSTYALRAPGAVGCSCAAAPGASGAAAAVGGRQWIATPATSSSGCSSNSAPWPCCSPKEEKLLLIFPLSKNKCF